MQKSKSVRYPQPIPSHLPCLQAYGIGPDITRDRPDLERTWIVPYCPYCTRPHLFEAGQAVRRSVCTEPKKVSFEDPRPVTKYGVTYGGCFNDPAKFRKLMRADMLRQYRLAAKKRKAATTH